MQPKCAKCGGTVNDLRHTRLVRKPGRDHDFVPDRREAEAQMWEARGRYDLAELARRVAR